MKLGISVQLVDMHSPFHKIKGKPYYMYFTTACKSGIVHTFHQPDVLAYSNGNDEILKDNDKNKKCAFD